jgi:hypothetical protein
MATRADAAPAVARPHDTDPEMGAQPRGWTRPGRASARSLIRSR